MTSLRDTLDSDEYDEFGLLPENAAEWDIPFTGQPVVSRESFALPSGQALSFLSWGEGEPELVFLHGGAQNGHTWDTVMLALGRPAVAVDLPGHGHSDRRGDRDYGPWRNAEAVAKLMEAAAPAVEEAGFPAGVCSILPGDPAAGETLVVHPNVCKVSFTGGPATASKILHACADTMKPATLELGGKSANIVFDDADLDVACGLGTMMSVGVLSGQGCAFPTRMLVQQPVYEDVVARVDMVAKSIPVGDPWDPAVLAGPVVNEAALDRIMGMIERAQKDGARLVSGGSRIGGDLAGGYYIEPTVFADVHPDSELAQNEVFGPVLAITPLSNEEEAIRIANSTRYGLSGYIQTQNLSRALRVAEELVTGEVLINGAANLRVQRPFGGIGISGMGKEGGRLGIEEFLRVKSVGVA